MIVKQRVPWVYLLLQIRGSSFEGTWHRILAATAIATIVTILEIRYGLEEYTLTITPFTLVGVALGIFLGFRNNAAYDRFWEGRKLWGSMVNTARTMARQAQSLTSGAPEAELIAYREVYIRRTIAFTHSLRHHLRDTDPMDDVRSFLSPDDFAAVEGSSHRPLKLLQQLGEDVAVARNRGWLPQMNVLAVDAQLVELSNILGACERIKNTPIPFTYTVLIHRIVAFYCLLLPFGLVETAGALTPVVVFLISHAFFGLDAVGEEIEEPFGVLPNHLPLDTISRNIEINLLEMLGETERPEPLQPRHGVLL